MPFQIWILGMKVFVSFECCYEPFSVGWWLLNCLRSRGDGKGGFFEEQFHWNYIVGRWWLLVPLVVPEFWRLARDHIRSFVLVESRGNGLMTANGIFKQVPKIVGSSFPVFGLGEDELLSLFHS